MTRARRTTVALAAVVLAALCVPTTGWAADPRPTSSFDLHNSLWPSAGWGMLWYDIGYPDWHTSEDPDDPVFADAQIPGAPRTPWRVLNVPEHAGLTAWLFEDEWSAKDPPRRSWTVALLLKLEEVDKPYRLLSVDGGDTFVIDLHDGHLRYGGATSGATSIARDVWYQIVVVRDDSTASVRAYVDGALDVEVSDPAGSAVYDTEFRLFDYVPWYPPPTVSVAQLARLRGWSWALSSEEIAGLEPLDGTPPEMDVSHPGHDAIAGLRPWFYGSVLADDTADKWNILTTIVLRDPRGAVAATYPANRARMYGPQMDWLREWAGGPPLARGARYRAEITATDGAGNSTTIVRHLIADDPPPAMVIHQPGAETHDPTPRLEGRTDRWEGDTRLVHAHILVPENEGRRAVSSIALDLDGAGRFAGQFVDPVPPGDYTLRVTHIGDGGARAAVVEQPLRVTATPVPRDDATPGAQGASRTGSAAALALRRAAVRALRHAGATRLLRRGARVRFAAAQPGRASVVVFSRGRAVARGQRKFGTARAATLAIRPTATSRRALARAARIPLLVRSAFVPRVGRPAKSIARITLRRR